MYYKASDTSLLELHSVLDKILANLSKLLTDPPPPSPRGLSSASTGTRRGMTFAKMRMLTFSGQSGDFPEYKKLWKILPRASTF